LRLLWQCPAWCHDGARNVEVSRGLDYQPACRDLTAATALVLGRRVHTHRGAHGQLQHAACACLCNECRSTVRNSTMQRLVITCAQRSGWRLSMRVLPPICRRAGRNSRPGPPPPPQRRTALCGRLRRLRGQPLRRACAGALGRMEGCGCWCCVFRGGRA